MTLPFNYLGIPIGVVARRRATWKPVIDKIKNKLAGWKNKTISLAGRICLINSILSAIPLYFLFFFRLPKTVLKEIISIQRKFMWGMDDKETKICWGKGNNAKK
uniref:Ribonuclease H protein At1g65750 family n=1 Tax=Cajanus cajan TaxID=3821 RepID=A0A151RC79_CAJCA|nr:Putative ribonuclease H protein At1g65750 family [Cajanus cajan]